MPKRKRGARKAKPTIWHSAREGIVADIEAFLELDPKQLNEVDCLGWTPLHYACYYGRKDAVRLLIEKGANVNLMTTGMIKEKGGVAGQYYELEYLGVTPLIIAGRKGYSALVADLLRAGADPGMLDLLGQSPADYATAKTRAILNFAAYTEKEPVGNPEEEEEEEG